MTLRFELIPLKDIVPDQNQPRKYFNEADMEELTASIKATGVIQPILVRPYGKKYMLVSGERRYRASRPAGLKEMPCVIKELTDEQALEIQIVENLQRKDVHPMEEAEAYKTLAMSKTLKEIAKQVGKTEAFVTKRMQLCNLIEEAKKAFYDGKCTIETAIKISSLDHGFQLEIIEENNYMGLDSYVKTIFSKKEYFLSSAKFPTDDPSYIENVPSCKVCPANSANKPLLFDDGMPPICTKPTCWLAKTAEFKRRIYDSHTVVDTHWNKVYEKKAIEAGFPVCKNFEKVSLRYADNPEMTIEEFIEDAYVCFAEDDDLDSMITYLIEEGDIQDAKEIHDKYEEYKINRKNEIKEYDQKVASGEIFQAYDLYEDQFVYIKKTEGNESKDNSSKCSNELSKVINKESRALQLDKIKLYDQVQKYVKRKDNDPDNILPGDNLLSLHAWVELGHVTWRSIDFSIVIAYMANQLKHDQDFKKMLNEKIKLYRVDVNLKSVADTIDLYEVLQDEDIQKFVFKYFAYNVAFPSYNETHAESNVLTYASMEFAKKNFNQSCHDYSTIINEKAQKRIEKYDAKIAQLKAAGHEEEE
jgi:ParB/RepB/Spo0J family partition protein